MIFFLGSIRTMGLGGGTTMLTCVSFLGNSVIKDVSIFRSLGGLDLQMGLAWASGQTVVRG